MIPCRRCGSAETELMTGARFGMVRCRSCRRRFMAPPRPLTVDEAGALVLTRGIAAGRSIADVAQTESGRKYLAWVAKHHTRRVAEAARVYLAAKGAEHVAPTT